MCVRRLFALSNENPRSRRMILRYRTQTILVLSSSSRRVDGSPWEVPLVCIRAHTRERRRLLYRMFSAISPNLLAASPLSLVAPLQLFRFFWVSTTSANQQHLFTACACVCISVLLYVCFLTTTRNVAILLVLNSAARENNVG